MMKNAILTLFVLCSISVVYSQDYKVLEKYILEKDSLQRLVKAEREQVLTFQKSNKALVDTINILRSDLGKLEKYRSEKEKIDLLIRQKTDSVALLQVKITKGNEQVADERKQNEQKVKSAYEKGKGEALDAIVNTYKNKEFDELIQFSTKMSVQRDLQLVGNNTELKSVLIDLEEYFKANEFLGQKYNALQIKNAQSELNLIKQQSVSLDRLREKIENYSLFNDGAKEMINKITVLDKKEIVMDMGAEIQKLKFNKILNEISPYIFNYDFNFGDYPYLSNIILEIIKRKQPNPDADIVDLLNKL